MNLCINCKCITNNLIKTDDEPNGVRLCDECLHIEIELTLNKLIEDGLVTSKYDLHNQDIVYRLRKDV